MLGQNAEIFNVTVDSVTKSGNFNKIKDLFVSVIDCVTSVSLRSRAAVERKIAAKFIWINDNRSR